MKINTKTMNRWCVAAALFGLTAAGALGPARAQDQAANGYRTNVEVRIGLPAGADRRVAIMPGANRLTLELPRGAEFPLDFTASTGGLVRTADVTALEGDRVRLVLTLSLGLLDEVTYEPDSVVLRFGSRFDVQPPVDAEDAADQYKLGPDDKIVVTVHGHQDLNSSLTVTDAGYITAPLVGDIKAAGLTPGQLATRLAELLGRDYLVSPQVDVNVEEFESQWVMVAGEIRIPGRVALRGGTRLKEVLSEAGGFGESSGELITITRKSTGDNEVNLEISRADFEAGVANPMLQSGDIVTISKAKFVYLQGEVGQPGRVRVERDLTLLKALAQVGGLTDWANLKEVQILAPEGGTPRVFNVKVIQNGKKPDPPLYGGEIIVVKRRFF